VAFRNTVSGISTERRSATLRRAPGKLLVDLPGGAIFRGQQGGAFAPPQATFNLTAQGLGFRWSVEGTVPAWLEVAPLQGELRDNQSVQAVAKLRPAAQALAPGTYEGQLAFKNIRSGEVTQRIARVVVDPRPPPPSGKLAIDVPHPLVFTGPQGGPFAPQRLALNLKAVGPGLKWTAEGTPAWLELTPAAGEIRENASAEVALKPRASAQALTPGTYEGKIAFKKIGPGAPIVQTVRLVVSITLR
jgi:Viral BACON domain